MFPRHSIFLLIILCYITIVSSQSTVVDIPVVSNSTDDTQPEENIVPCVPGIHTGYGLVRKPNITSKVIVGTQFNVSWDWTVTITNPPSYLDIYIQLFAPGLVEKWSTQVAKQVPSEPRWFMWTPEGLVDGKYKLRFVPDGKETFNVPADKLPCFSNGESVPFVTAQFSVSNSKGDLGVYPDPFSPNSSRRNSPPFSIVLSFVTLVLFHYV